MLDKCLCVLNMLSSVIKDVIIISIIIMNKFLNIDVVNACPV